MIKSNKDGREFDSLELDSIIDKERVFSPLSGKNYEDPMTTDTQGVPSMFKKKRNTEQPGNALQEKLKEAFQNSLLPNHMLLIKEKVKKQNNDRVLFQQKREEAIARRWKQLKNRILDEEEIAAEEEA